MKRFGMIHSAMFLIVLAGAGAFGYAQHDDHGKGQDKQQEQAQPSRTQPGQQQRAPDSAQQGRGQQQHAQDSRQQNRGQQQQGAQGGRPQYQGQQQRPQDQQRPQQQMGAQQQPRMQQQQRPQPSHQQNNWAQHRAGNFESEHRTWTQRGGYQGFRVPDDRFRGNFGSSHSFHVFGLPYMEVGGRPRFQYGGYWFSMMEPYPEYWGADWYRNDDMYVDYYDGGYYLYDRRFANRPGVAISISF